MKKSLLIALLLSTFAMQKTFSNSFPIYGIISFSDTITGDTALAYEYFTKAQQFHKEMSYDSALFYSEQALMIYKKEREQEKQIRCYDLMGISFQEKGDYNNTLEVYNKALYVIEEKYGKDHFKIAQMYANMASAYNMKKKHNKALEYYNKALAIQDTSFGEHRINTAKYYAGIGLIHAQKGAYNKALEYYAQSLTLCEKLNTHSPDVAKIYENTASTYLKNGDYDKALKYYNEALLMYQNFDENHLHIARTHSNIGVTYREAGDYDKALEYYSQALATYKKLNSPHRNMMNTYSNIGVICMRKGDYDKALEYFHQSLSLCKRFDKTAPKSILPLVNIGNVYHSKKNYTKALEHYEKALSIQLKTFGEQHPETALIYTNIGAIYIETGNPQQALEYFNKSLPIGIKTMGEQHPKLGNTYSNIGFIHYKNKNYPKALSYYIKTLDIYCNAFGERHPRIGNIYRIIGSIYILEGNLDKALQYLQRSIISLVPGFKDTNIYTNPSAVNIAYGRELLYSIGLKARVLKKRYTKYPQQVTDLLTSLATHELELELIDRMRTGYKAEGSKLFLSEKSQRAHELAIQSALLSYETTKDLLYKEKAFLFAEKSKAAILATAFAESQAKRFAHIPEHFLQKEHNLKNRITYYKTHLKKGVGKDSIKARSIRDTLFSLQDQHETLIDELEKNYPEYYALKYNKKTASVKTIQNEIIDKNSLLIEYFLGDSTLSIFTISSTDIHIKQIPKDSTLEQTIRTFRKALINLDFENYLQQAHWLYRKLLKPIEKEIASKDRLIIIPDGILNYLPFEALLEKEVSEATNFSKLPYLIRKYTISYYNSASLLVQQQKKKQSIATDRFAGFAPVFSNDSKTGYLLETNLSMTQASSPDIRNALNRSVLVDGHSFSELPESEKEVTTILELFKNQQKPAEAYLHTTASEAKFKSIDIQNYSHLHIASHGFINEEEPALSGIVFNPGDTNSTEDGVLYAGELYNLKLNAALVVLSSCESGLGKIVLGEGIMGLTRGFMYAGARRIMVSLWQVDDQSTASLMIAFYNYLLEGMDYAAALRKAKLYLLEKESFAWPLDWSPFILIGY